MKKEIKDQIIEQIRYWWAVNADTGPAVVGISGGKDSSVVAALLVKALGKENVLGVLMPNGMQADIGDSHDLCNVLDLYNITVDIQDAVAGLVDAIPVFSHFKLASDLSRFSTNIPPRIRMTVLYAVAQRYGGRVINTSNASEAYLGWGTLYGDTAGDFAPIKNLFVDEVVELGSMLRLPVALIKKAPADGLTGRTDEENLGFSYADVKPVALRIPGWNNADANLIAKIEGRHKASEFKRNIIAVPGIDFYRDRQGEILAVK